MQSPFKLRCHVTASVDTQQDLGVEFASLIMSNFDKLDKYRRQSRQTELSRERRSLSKNCRVCIANTVKDPSFIFDRFISAHIFTVQHISKIQITLRNFFINLNSNFCTHTEKLD